MSDAARFLTGRLIAGTIGYTILLGGIMRFYYQLAVPIGLVAPADASDWAWLATLEVFPTILAISLIASFFYGFSFALANRQSLRRSESPRAAELLPGVFALALFFGFAILAVQTVLVPGVAASRFSLEERMPELAAGRTRAIDRESLIDAIDRYYAGLFQENLGNEVQAITLWNEATGKINRVLKEAPRQTLALQYRAALEDARRALEERRRERARYAKEITLFQEGFRSYQAGEYRQAIDRFEQILRVQPGHALAARYIVEARRRLDREGARRRLRQKEADLAEREAGILVQATALEAEGKLREALALAEDLLFVNQFNNEARALRTRLRTAIRTDDFFVEEFPALHLGESRRDLLLPLGEKRYLQARYFIRFNEDWYLSGARLVTLDAAGRLAGLIRAPHGKWVAGRLVLRDLETWTKDGTWLKREIERFQLPLPPATLWAIDGFLGRGLPIPTPLVTELMPVFESLAIPLVRPRLSLVSFLTLPVSMICLSLLIAGAGLRHPETQAGVAAPLRWICIAAFPVAATFMLTIPRNLLPALSLLGDDSPFLGWFLPAAGTLLLVAAAVFHFSRSRPPYRKA